MKWAKKNLKIRNKGQNGLIKALNLNVRTGGRKGVTGGGDNLAAKRAERTKLAGKKARANARDLLGLPRPSRSSK